MAGIYIHIPFCKQKCTYCDFHFSTTFSNYREALLNAISMELIERKAYLENKIVNTIYFGGGTPSLLNETELKDILNTIQLNFPIDPNVEITLEANPDDITNELLQAWKNLGINRLSIGIQSMVQGDLDWMNRAHTVEQAKSSIRQAKEKGFDNITVDLIYGLPNMTIKHWQNNLNEIVKLDIQHISAYCLTVEEKTALAKFVKDGKLTISNENEQSEQFSYLVNTLKEHGFAQYEISNFSKPEYESKHNSNYWVGEWYLGVGPSAHSFNGRSRSWNISNNSKYINCIMENTNYIETELLSDTDRFNEHILVGLRTSAGVDINRLKSIAPITEAFRKKLSDFIEYKWIIDDGKSLILTEEGKLKADHISSELFR